MLELITVLLGHNNLSGLICMEISSYEVIIKLGAYASLPLIPSPINI